MKKINFNQGWEFQKEGTEGWQAVDLPHDAMLAEKRDPDCSNGSNTGFFPGGKYLYRKRLEVPADWMSKCVLLEFEGVYRKSTVEINGKIAGGHRYGYTNFFVDATPYFLFGSENEIIVKADNSQEPNSRWYSGSGIYRSVALWMGDPAHILPQGIKIDAPDGNITVKTEFVAPEKEYYALRIEISYDGKIVAEVGEAAEVQKLVIPDPKLWSAENPNLYTCKVILLQDGHLKDEASTVFGIRRIEWGAQNGLRVNGAEVKLRGGCVHHDNGILGAATFPAAEQRRVRIMKEAGFNAIRSSHNPMSKAMLDACDRLGMYVMDEAFDQWYIRKTKYDYSADFESNWQADLLAMVEKDYNHPCVLMYSIGNEVSETAQVRGIELTGKMVEFIHSLDSYRAVTCGINLMLNGLASLGMGIYKQDDQVRVKQKKKKSAKPQKQKASGSAFFNAMMNTVGSAMKNIGRLGFVDKATRDAFEKLDICGYNYGSGRYPKEGENYPQRVVVGSETFPFDIAKNWCMVEKYPYLIGDFMWTSWDYLGEAGMGAWNYSDQPGGAAGKPYPWLLAGCGVIDITGLCTAEAYYAQTVWGLIDRPYIAVRPVDRYPEKPTISMWRGTNAVESWAWDGCEGKKAIVEVYSDTPQVELQLNGKTLGTRKAGDTANYRAMFKVAYEPGKLTALARDKNGKELSRNSLHSAEDGAEIRATVDRQILQADGEDLAFINIEFTDSAGTVRVLENRSITVLVEGAGTLLSFGSADPCTEESFLSNTHKPYHGRAQAIVRAGSKPGKITVIISADGLESKEVEMSVK